MSTSTLTIQLVNDVFQKHFSKEDVEKTQSIMTSPKKEIPLSEKISSFRKKLSFIVDQADFLEMNNEARTTAAMGVHTKMLDELEEMFWNLEEDIEEMLPHLRYQKEAFLNHYSGATSEEKGAA